MARTSGMHTMSAQTNRRDLTRGLSFYMVSQYEAYNLETLKRRKTNGRQNTSIY